MKNVIVAGANGFLGKNLVKNLLERGYKVTALGMSFDEELLRTCQCICMKDKSVQAIAPQLREQYACFYDLAWAGTSGALRADYNVQIDNIRLTCDYVKLSAGIHCNRFIYASSINEMETYEYLQSDDVEPSGGYIYGTGKLAAHLMGETVAYQSQVAFIPLIITNIYGKGEKSARLICSSIKKLLQGEHCSFTAGVQTYDFIYISDAINAIVEIGEKGTAFTRYYIGSGKPKALREFLLQMRDVVAPEEKIGLGDLPFKGANIDYRQFDMRRVEKDAGYVPEVSFEEGIRATAQWIRDNEE